MSKVYCNSCAADFDKSSATAGSACPVCRGTLVSPITGVVSLHNLPGLFSDYPDSTEINLEYEGYMREHRLTCDDEDCTRDGHSPYGDTWEDDSGDTRLIGDWKADEGEDGQWDTDESENEGCGYAAIMRETVVQVVWSRDTTKVRSMCSPCYPGQADLDSGDGDILCYTMPDDMFEEDGGAESPVLEIEPPQKLMNDSELRDWAKNERLTLTWGDEVGQVKASGSDGQIIEFEIDDVGLFTVKEVI